jgi:hypothetical protein
MEQIQNDRTYENNFLQNENQELMIVIFILRNVKD